VGGYTTMRIATGLLFLAISTPAFANEGGKHTVLLILTQGINSRGGQEVGLPNSGEIPEGATTIGPCNPGFYRWTAVPE